MALLALLIVMSWLLLIEDVKSTLSPMGLLKPSTKTTASHNSDTVQKIQTHHCLNPSGGGGKAFGAVDLLLVIIGMLILYTMLDCICCVCCQRGILWQKYGDVFDETLYDEIGTPQIIITVHD